MRAQITPDRIELLNTPRAFDPALSHRRTFSVMEIFGPTVQGEGPDAGLPCYFVRFGGCDYRCSWCDSPQAVDPARVRAEAERLTAEQIIERLDALPGRPGLVVISGGNPALHQLEGLVALLHQLGYCVSVETQGSRWRPWLASVDRLIVSPKPPSSGMATPKHEEETRRFFDKAIAAGLDIGDRMAVKIVVGDDMDLAWAIAWTIALRSLSPSVPVFLSALTDPPAPGEPIEQTRTGVCDRYRWLCEAVSLTPALSRAKVLPQLHVLAWGHETAR